jgi:hypothetical protein
MGAFPSDVLQHGVAHSTFEAVASSGQYVLITGEGEGALSGLPESTQPGGIYRSRAAAKSPAAQESHLLGQKLPFKSCTASYVKLELLEGLQQLKATIWRLCHRIWSARDFPETEMEDPLCGTPRTSSLAQTPPFPIPSHAPVLALPGTETIPRPKHTSVGYLILLNPGVSLIPQAHFLLKLPVGAS